MVVLTSGLAYNKSMQGVYDYRGECFGYIVGNILYDLQGEASGLVTPKAITALDGTLIWHRDRDGLYDLHWESVGYIGSPTKEEEYHDNR
jgi:hypothetical protein